MNNDLEGFGQWVAQLTLGWVRWRPGWQSRQAKPSLILAGSVPLRAETGVPGTVPEVALSVREDSG